MDQEPEALPKKKKIFDWKTLAAIGVGTFILVLALFVVFNVADITRKFIEKLGTQTLGVPVHIGELVFEPEDKRIIVRGIVVGNPEGFNEPYALTVEGLNIELAALEGNQLIISRIETMGSSVMLEAKNNRTNLATIRQNMNRQAAMETQAKDNAPPVEVVIQKIDIHASNLYINLNGNELEPMVLPAFTITGIGEAEGAVLSSEAIAQIMDHLTRQAVARALESGALNHALTPQAIADLKAGLNLDYIGRAKETIEGLRGKVEDFIDQQKRR